MRGAGRPALVLLAVGVALAACALEPDREEQATGSAAAEPELKLRAGMEISLAQTLLGLGAGLAEWTGNETGVKQITVAESAPDELVVGWREEIREETEASRRRREAFERDPPKAGVGEPEPAAPEPEYARRTREGRISATGIATSREMTLPALWPEGEHAVSGNSLIWLSRPAFRELRSSRETEWSLGLMQNPLFQPAAAVARLRDGLAALEERLDGSPEERRELDRIEAEADFATFELTVDGRELEVPTIVARNWLAEYRILDDEDNPLILKVTLNPLSGGALDVFSPLGALKAVVGYQVTEIRTGPAGGA